MISRDEIARSFRWQTMEGTVLKLSEMETRHIFNCMKMLFNHIAEAYNVPTVWYQHRYADQAIKARMIPKELARHIYLFVTEIEARDDLPMRYFDPYKKILDIIRSGIIKDPERLMYRKQIKGE